MNLAQIDDLEKEVYLEIKRVKDEIEQFRKEEQQAKYVQLKMLQALPLDIKIEKSKLRIEEWYNHWNGKVYVSFSGGKDSTVLLHLVRSMYPEVPAVFVNTGLEYPEILKFVRETENVTWLKPKMRFKEVIEKYGYPVISKEISSCINEIRNTKSDYLRNKRLNGKSGSGKISNKWRFLIKAPFKISAYCCSALKKSPLRIFENAIKLKPIIGTMTTDSKQRERIWYKDGCNSFNTQHPNSKPLSFWNEEDIWNYIKLFNLSYSKIYDMGYERTGCMFCMFGCHLDKEKNKFQVMKDTHPKLYNYCMTNLGLKDVLSYCGIPYE